MFPFHMKKKENKKKPSSLTVNYQMTVHLCLDFFVEQSVIIKMKSIFCIIFILVTTIKGLKEKKRNDVHCDIQMQKLPRGKSEMSEE